MAQRIVHAACPHHCPDSCAMRVTVEDGVAARIPLEHFDVHNSYGHTYLLANERAIAPHGERQPNSEVSRRLARRMGFAEDCFGESDVEIGAQAFGGGVDFAAMRRDGWVHQAVPEAPFAAGGFRTANGRAQFAPGGLGGADYLAPYESPQSTPELARRYPLAMIPPPARRGLTDGAIVRTFNDRGEYRCKLAISERARSGVVVGLGVCWRKLGPAGTNTNELTSQRLTDIGRGTTF